jgi:hypothetical protein
MEKIRWLSLTGETNMSRESLLFGVEEAAHEGRGLS